MLVDLLVEASEKSDGLQVFPAPVSVWNPLPFLAAVIQVQHGGHGVHPQAVGMVPVQPAQGTAQQIALHFGAPVIEDQAAPVRMDPLAGVGVFEEIGPVKIPQAVLVAREMGRHPVQDNPYAVPVPSFMSPS